MDGRAIPDDQQLAADFAQQQAQEADDIGGAVSMLLGLHEQAPGSGEAADGRERDLGELLGGEPRLAARGGMAPQRLDPLLPGLLEPLADRSTGYPQCSGDVLLLPALLFQLPGASPPSLAPVELGRLRLHAASIPSF